MKCRVFKNGENVILNWPSPMYQNDENWNECKVPDELKGLERKDLEEDEIPIHDFHEQLYPDFEENGEAYVKVDKNWERKLMPTWLIKEKHIGRLNLKINLEFEKESPDLIEVIQLQGQKEQLATWNDKKVYEQAVINLDEDDHDKPLIREKLAQKIAELSEGEQS